jgi:hypothetical protein
MKTTVFCDIALCSLVEVYRRFRGAYCLGHEDALMVEAVSTSETSVNFYQTTRRNISEDIHCNTFSVIKEEPHLRTSAGLFTV